MALIPDVNKPARGIIGTWANMEEDNARTFFAASEFVAGIPVTYDAADNNKCKPLVAASRFIGIALRTVDMLGDPETDGTATYRQNSLLGVADMGCVFVQAGEDVSAGDAAYYRPSDNKFYKTPTTDDLKLPECEFDEDGAKDEPVALRIRVTPGHANVTAEN